MLVEAGKSDRMFIEELNIDVRLHYLYKLENKSMI